jgi:hypothetical protein
LDLRGTKVIGGWKRLVSEELHSFYSSPNIIRVFKSRRMRWTERVSRMGYMKYSNTTLVGKPEGNRPLERPKRKWKNIRMGPKEIGWKDVEWIHLGQDNDQWRNLVNTVMNIRIL